MWYYQKMHSNKRLQFLLLLNFPYLALFYTHMFSLDSLMKLFVTITPITKCNKEKFYRIKKKGCVFQTEYSFRINYFHWIFYLNHDRGKLAPNLANFAFSNKERNSSPDDFSLSQVGLLPDWLNLDEEAPFLSASFGWVRFIGPSEDLRKWVT